MKKLKKLKKLMKREKFWRSYSSKYKHRQMKLVFSKVALAYNDKLELDSLLKIERLALEAKREDEDKMFITVFRHFEELTNEKANWDEFSKFMWYVYETSRYWRDVTNRKDNIYNKNNFLELNKIKRHHYYAWVDSLNHKDFFFNDKLIKVMKAVF